MFFIFNSFLGFSVKLTIPTYVEVDNVPGQKETSPCPSAVLPFGRDVEFVERGALLNLINQKCAKPGSRTALVGLGALGT